jgi:hypothetical protein
MQHVHTDTSVLDVNHLHTPQPIARRSAKQTKPSSDTFPSYLRNLTWSEGNPNPDILAIATTRMDPLPQPPPNEFSNVEALTTIRNNPHLFRIVTPIRAAVLKRHLSLHPNQPLVLSVCLGLTNGFWPWAITDVESRPLTWDNSSRPFKEEAHASFVREQRDMEICLERFSASFGPDLLPGMFAVPLGVVPKPHSTKLRMVVDHSVELFSPNSMIPRDRVAVPLNNLHHLGHTLLAARSRFGLSTHLIIFKSDVLQAYRHLPMHPLWQIHQVVTIDGQRHVDRCNNFGNRAAGGIWGTFIGLVIWIAIFIKHLHDLFAYVDDVFSWEFESNVMWYAPYRRFFPMKQAQLLLLWDELGIPHEEPKQLFGPILTIIGFEVNSNAMTITMPPDKRLDLIQSIRTFATPATHYKTFSD